MSLKIHSKHEFLSAGFGVNPSGGKDVYHLHDTSGQSVSSLQAELQKQVEQSKALAEAEGRIKENRANEDINRRQLAQRLEAERQKLMEAIDSTFRCGCEPCAWNIHLWEVHKQERNL